MKPHKKTKKPNQHPQNKSLNIPTNANMNSGVNSSTDMNNSNNDKPDSSEKSEWSKYADRWKDPIVVVTFMLVAVTGFLAYYTYKLFNDAANANDRNKGAIEAAQRSADASVNALIEQKKEFELTNKPFLQATNIYISQLQVGKPLEVTYAVINFTDIPALLTAYSSRNCARRRENSPTLNEMLAPIDTNYRNKNVNAIITKSI